MKKRLVLTCALACLCVGTAASAAPIGARSMSVWAMMLNVGNTIVDDLNGLIR